MTSFAVFAVVVMVVGAALGAVRVVVFVLAGMPVAAVVVFVLVGVPIAAVVVFVLAGVPIVAMVMGVGGRVAVVAMVVLMVVGVAVRSGGGLGGRAATGAEDECGEEETKSAHSKNLGRS